MAGTHGTFSLLQRSCALLVAACLLHLTVVIVFYIRTFSKVEHFQTPDETRHEPGAHSSIVAPTPEVHTETTRTVHTCPEFSPHLEGPRDVEISGQLELAGVLDDTRLSLGGHYTPSECVSQQKVALIIPFRDRELHLEYWLLYMHPFLQRQQLDYGVYVIEQDGNETFNRAKLLNVGYAEALKDYDYNCFVFSDVDLIPMDDRNIYKCYSEPRHLSAAIDKFHFKYKHGTRRRDALV